MSAKFPIPPQWQEAMRHIVYTYAAGDWTPGGPDDDLYLTVDLIPYTFEAACDFIGVFDDALPEDLLKLLLVQIDALHRDLRGDLADRKTYSAAARSLRLLMQRKRDAAQ
jgi:hypothetical protein